MVKEKKTVHRIQMTEGKRQIIQQLLQEYNIETTADIQAALRDLLGGTIKEMMESEMDQHLGYQKSERSDSDDYRNGYKKKTVNTSVGSLELDVPQDRKSTFEPQIVKKRQKDISEIDQKIICYYSQSLQSIKIDQCHTRKDSPEVSITGTSRVGKIEILLVRRSFVEFRRNRRS